MMRNRGTWIGVAASWLLLSPQALAQDRALDELLAEVRLLRQALERQSVIGTRTQLLVSRLALQDQRVARSRAALERLDSELASAAQERNRIRMQIAGVQRAIEQATDPARRSALEQELRMSQTRSRDHESHLAELQSRQSQAKLAFDAENARFDELESWMTQLEKELDKLNR